MAIMIPEASKSTIPPGPLIAVVDDDESIRRALGRLLKVAGFRTEAFSSAQEFLDSGREDRFGCLVLDIHLGGMSGLELMGKLSVEGRRAPVVLITAHDDEATREKASAAGASSYLRKPIDADVLLEAINKALTENVAH